MFKVSDTRDRTLLLENQSIPFSHFSCKELRAVDMGRATSFTLLSSKQPYAVGFIERERE